MENLRFALVLNGPPGCGKDTIANVLNAEYKFRKHQFKDALYAHTAKHFEIDVDKFIHYASDRKLKDSKSLAGLGGRTPREALIHISEDIYKPRFGNDYFGKAEVNRLESLYGHLDSPINVVYPDGGFIDEVITSKQFFHFVVVIRLHRHGFDFSGDSRSYLYPERDCKITSEDVYLKDGHIEEGVEQVLEVLRKNVYGIEKSWR